MIILGKRHTFERIHAFCSFGALILTEQVRPASLQMSISQTVWIGRENSSLPRHRKAVLENNDRFPSVSDLLARFPLEQGFPSPRYPRIWLLLTNLSLDLIDPRSDLGFRLFGRTQSIKNFSYFFGWSRAKHLLIPPKCVNDCLVAKNHRHMLDVGSIRTLQYDLRV